MQGGLGLAAVTNLEMPGVDLVDDLKVAGKNTLQHVDGPAFQGLREEGVVGVGKGPGDDAPGFLPGQLLQVHENVHELGDAESWVRVVELDGHLHERTRETYPTTLITANPCTFLKHTHTHINPFLLSTCLNINMDAVC